MRHVRAVPLTAYDPLDMDLRVDYTRPRPSLGRVLLSVVLVGLLVMSVVAIVGGLVRAGSGGGGDGVVALPFMGQQDPARPRPLSPEQAGALLGKVPAALAGMNTVTYVSEANLTGLAAPPPGSDSPGTITVTLHGQVALPGSLTLNSDSPQMGQYVVIGDSTWSRSNGNPGWVMRSSATTNLGLLHPLTGWALLQVPVASTVREVGYEEGGDGWVRHLTFEVDSDRLTGLAVSGLGDIARSLSPGSTVMADAWVHEGSALPSTVAFAADLGGGRLVRVRTIYSGYGEAVTIAPPDTTPALAP